MSGPRALFSIQNSISFGFRFSLVLGFCTLILPSGPVHAAGAGAGAAAPVALPVCDPNYYITLKEKAWMETMREVQVNNTVITQPPSVLSLSCFDSFASQTAAGGSIFTNTGSSFSPVLSAISTTMGSSFTSYIGANFAGAVIPATPASTTGFCNTLARVWEGVKCTTVDNKNGTTGYLLSDLQQFQTNAAATFDVRGSTGVPTCTTDAANLDTRYKTGLKSSSDLAGTATTRGSTNYFSAAHPNFCAYDPKEGKALDDGDICSKSATTPKKCSDMPAIPTGLAVTYTGGSGGNDPWGNAVGTAYWSYRCLNPGCYFDVKKNANSIKFSSGSVPPTGQNCSEKPY